MCIYVHVCIRLCTYINIIRVHLFLLRVCGWMWHSCVGHTHACKVCMLHTDSKSVNNETYGTKSYISVYPYTVHMTTAINSRGYMVCLYAKLTSTTPAFLSESNYFIFDTYIHTYTYGAYVT